jgi:citrate synthase
MVTEKMTVSSESVSADRAPKGLENVVAGPSFLTFLDGLQGKMIYRGYDAIELAGRVSYEEVVHLLWEGDLPKRAPLDALKKTLADNRALPGEVVDQLRKFPLKSHPMDVLRGAVCLLALHDPETSLNTPEANRRKAIRLVALIATVTATWDRIRKGEKILDPDPSLGHGANFLYMLTGRRPDALQSQAMDMYLTLLADHDLNASTFAARVVTSTLSDIHSAIGAAVGALKGSLHGGANEKVMEMFKEIGQESNAVAYIEKAIAEKKKIMGFGHRVYKVEDPRSGPLKEMSRRLGEAHNNLSWYTISVKVAATVYQHKKINTNVDFYSASVLYDLGIPIDLFTPVFAISRIAGWSAHVFEQLADNRLIRPRTQYMGPVNRTFVSLDQR